MFLPDKKRRILAAVIAAALVCAFVVIRLVSGTMNPISRTVMAVAGLRDISGGNVTVSLTDERKLSMELDFQLGSDLKDSVFDGRISGLRTVAEGGDLAVDAGGVRVFLEDFFDLLEGRLAYDMELNSLVKDSGINYEYISGLFDNSEVLKLLAGFVLRECGKKKVLDSFLSGYDSKDDITEYTLDMGAFKAAFVSYLERCKTGRDEELGKAAAELLDSEYLSATPEGTVRISYVLTDKRLSRWEMAFEGWSLTVGLDNYNAPELDSEEIGAFMSETKEKSSGIAARLLKRLLTEDDSGSELQSLMEGFFK